MKRKLLLMSLAGLVIASCTSEDSFTNDARESKIRFEAPLMSKVTKAVTGEIGGTIYPTEEDFTVFGIQYKNNFKGWASSEDVRDFWTGGSEFTGIVVSHEGASTGANAAWAPENDYYWPSEPYKLAFAAYSPSRAVSDAASIAYTANGLTITDFKVNSSAENHYDLMFSNREYDCSRAVNENIGVPVKFNHALSSIVFAASEQVDNKTYQIKNIELIGDFKNKGSFCTNIVESTDATPYTENSTPGWTNVDFIDVSSKTQTYIPEISGGVYDVTGVPDEFTDGESAILPIPQDVPTDAYVHLEYAVTTTLPSGETVTDNYDNINIKLSDFIINGTTENIKKWEMNKRYVYVIHFGGSKKVFFVPNVIKWETGAVAEYTIGGNN